MNASDYCTDATFFLPDLWTHIKPVAEPDVAKLYALLGALVNGNATADTSIPKPMSRILPVAVEQKWAHAAFPDRFLANVFISL